MNNDNQLYLDYEKYINYKFNNNQRKITIKNILNIHVFYKIIILIMNSILFGLISFLALIKIRKYTVMSYNTFSNQTIIFLIIAIIFNDLFFSKFNKIFLINNKYELLMFLFLLIFLYLLL